MFKGEYKTKTAQGTPITYMIGDSVVYQGKVYTAVNQTQKSPLQSPKDWKYIGLTEPVQGSSSPLLPEENQFWVDQSNNLYIRKDGLNSVWQTISGSASGISASGGVTFFGTVASDSGYRITSNAINAQTGTTYTFLAADNGKIITFNNGSTTTVTIPTGLPVGFNCTAIQLGTGQVGFTAASGVTLQSYGNQYRMIGQHASATIIEYSDNIINLSGNLIV